MKCPLCDAPMREVTRRGVKIDLCPECKGVWLDRGELDHLLEVADTESRDYRDRDDDRRDYERERERREYYYEQKKKKNWLSEIFD